MIQYFLAHGNWRGLTIILSDCNHKMRHVHFRIEKVLSEIFALNERKQCNNEKELTSSAVITKKLLFFLFFKLISLSYIHIFTSFAVANDVIVCDLSNCIDYALNKSSDIKSAEAFVSYYEGRLQESKYNFWLPELNVKADLGYISGEPTQPFTLIRGIAVRRNQSGPYYNYGAELVLPVFHEGTFIAMKSPSITKAEMDLKRENFTYQNEKDEVLYLVTEAFYSALKAQDDVRLIQEKLEHQKLLLTATEMKYKNSLISKGELLMMIGEVSLRENELMISKNNLKNSLARLAISIGAEPSTKIELRESLYEYKTLLKPETLIENAYQSRPDIRAKLALVEREKAALLLSNKGGLPEFHIVTDYNRGDDYESPRNDNYSVSLQLRMYLMDNVIKRSRSAQEKALILKEEKDLSKLKKLIALEITETYNNTEAIKNQIDMLQTQLEMIYLEDVNVAEERYKNNLISESSLKKAKVSLTEKINELKTLKFELQKNYALLQKLTGSHMIYQ